MDNQIKVKELLEKITDYELLTDKKTLENIITTPELSRAGLSLLKYSDVYAYDRVQIYGKMEYTYIEETIGIESEPHLYNENTPLIVFARGYRPSDLFIQRAEEKNIAVVMTEINTTKTTSKLHSFLNYELAPSQRMHGVLLNVLGTGVMIKGQSGIGKSEVALELIQKGSLLVADDAVVIKKIDDNTLEGSAPDILKNRMEIRGIGIVDIQKLYGVASVLSSNRIDLIIEFKDFTNSEDRLGNKYEYQEILGVNVQKISLPVLKGRSLANMVSVAVANFQLKTQHNYDSTQDFLDSLNNALKENANE